MHSTEVVAEAVAGFYGGVDRRAVTEYADRIEQGRERLRSVTEQKKLIG